MLVFRNTDARPQTPSLSCSIVSGVIETSIMRVAPVVLISQKVTEYFNHASHSTSSHFTKVTKQFGGGSIQKYCFERVCRAGTLMQIRATAKSILRFGK